jgi:hypothetical protein
MKNLSKYTQVALAVATFCASSVVMADGDNYDNNNNRGDDVNYSSSTDVDIEKEVKIERDIEVEGKAYVHGLIHVGASSAALVNQNQTNKDNTVNNDIVNNNAGADDNALKGASGNIGLNITAGDNNFQDNSAALSAVDAAFVFADAETISYQNASKNHTENTATTNNAGLAGNVLQNASGNIAVNVSAGDSNLQANSLAASVNNSGTMAEANASSTQTGYDNHTDNNGANYTIYDQTQVSLNGGLLGSSLSTGHGGYQGTASGTTSGTSDQIGNVYPDMWSNDPYDDPTHAHPTNNDFIGHIDLDTSTQGGSDLNGDGGALAFNNDGTYDGTESGDLGFVEVGYIALGGTFSGVVNNTETVFLPHENNAGLSGNSLRGASGNIGVNIAAGTNNLQGNHLAIAAAMEKQKRRYGQNG